MNRERLVFGATFVALGTLLLLEWAGELRAWPVVADWWPTVVIAIGIAQVVIRPRRPLGGVIVTSIGIALLLGSLDVADTARLLWPVVLIGVGLWLVARRPSMPGPPAPAIDVRGEIVAIFDDLRARPQGTLAQRTVTAVFGDVDLDLLASTIGHESTLRVTTIFGDVDVRVPPTWRITVTGPELFGGVTVDVPPPRDPDAPVLHLEVVTIFGDLEVRVGAEVVS